jgi:hypothetical protein
LRSARGSSLPHHGWWTCWADGFVVIHLVLALADWRRIGAMITGRSDKEKANG